MKGLAIVILLLAAILGSLYALLRPSDADLRRLEEEIAAQLGDAEAELTEATRILNALRAVKPNILALDNDLNALRGEHARQRALLARLQEERPDQKDSRATFIENRRQARATAGVLRDQAADLVARTATVDSVVREVQPRVIAMKAAFAELYNLRATYQEAGRDIDDALATRIDYVRAEVQLKQSLAKGALDAALTNAEQGATMRDTAIRELEQAIAEIRAVTERLAQLDR